MSTMPPGRPTPTADVCIRVVSAFSTWYHCRSVGTYHAAAVAAGLHRVLEAAAAAVAVGVAGAGARAAVAAVAVGVDTRVP